MRYRFRPKRITDFSEMTDWIFRINDEAKEQLTKQDKREEMAYGHADGRSYPEQ